MKKILSFVVVAFTFILFMSSANALEKPVDIGKNDSWNEGEMVIDGGSDNKNVTITVNSADLKMVKADTGISRYKDAAWIGVRIFAPKNTAIDTLKNSAYVTADEQGIRSELKSFWANQDTPAAKKDNEGEDHYINVFLPVSMDELTAATKAGQKMTYIYHFDWEYKGQIENDKGKAVTNDFEPEQTITIVVDPAKVVLEDLNTTNKTWTEEIYNEVKAAAEAEKDKQEPATKPEAAKPSKKDDVPKTGMLFVVDYTKYLVK